MTNRSRVILFVLLFIAAGIAIYSHSSSVGEKWPPGWTTQRLTAVQVEQQKQWVYKMFSAYDKLEGQDASNFEGAFAVADSWIDLENDPDLRNYCFVSYSGIKDRKLRPNWVVVVSKKRNIIVTVQLHDPSYM